MALTPHTPDPLLPSVTTLAQSRQVITIPWMLKPVRLGTCFRSSRAQTGDPFPPGSPLFAEPCVGIYRSSGAVGSYRSSNSCTAKSTTDHLSASLGISAGCSFLNASATGTYDRDVLDNVDACKTSVSTMYRCGTIALVTPPPSLHDRAVLTIKYEGGLDLLQQRYGDYYVAAYVLGAEAGALISRDTSSNLMGERLSVTAQLKVLMFTASTTRTTTTVKSSRSAKISVSAFCTMDNQRIQETADEDGPRMQHLAKDVNTIINKVDTVSSRVDNSLKDLNIRDGEPVSGEMCDRLCESGLVVELVLLPVETLHEVQYWATSTSII